MRLIRDRSSIVAARKIRRTVDGAGPTRPQDWSSRNDQRGRHAPRSRQPQNRPILHQAPHLATQPNWPAPPILRRKVAILPCNFTTDAMSLAVALVPVLIDGRQIKRTYSEIVASLIRGGLPESEDPRFKLKPLHESGRIVVLVDNVDPANLNHVNFLTTLRQDYPKARLIVAVKMPFVDTQRLRPVIGIEDSDFLQLRTLTRGNSEC